MNISIFLARFLGLYLVLVSLPFIFYPKGIRPILEKTNKNSAILFCFAILTLITGILLVLLHNIWVFDWRIVITILAWLTLIKGVFRFYFPKTARKLVAKIRQQNHWIAGIDNYTVMGMAILVIGLYLGYYGFFHH